LTAQRATRVSLVAWIAALAVALAGCGGSGTSSSASYDPDEVERAFREAGLPLRRVPSAGAEQPAMGETSSCGTRYLVRSRGSLIAVSVCDTEGDAEDVAPDGSMHRGNVAVETAAGDAATHQRISQALDGLEG